MNNSLFEVMGDSLQKGKKKVMGDKLFIFEIFYRVLKKVKFKVQIRIE